jgi:hypothetical protein
MSKQCPSNSPKAQDPNYICNPQSGRWIKKDGARARKLKIGIFSSPCPSNSPKAKDPSYICNGKTGRWIKRNGSKALTPYSPPLPSSIELDPDFLDYIQVSKRSHKRLVAIPGIYLFEIQYNDEITEEVLDSTAFFGSGILEIELQGFPNVSIDTGLGPRPYITINFDMKMVNGNMTVDKLLDVLDNAIVTAFVDPLWDGATVQHSIEDAYLKGKIDYTMLSDISSDGPNRFIFNWTD